MKRRWCSAVRLAILAPSAWSVERRLPLKLQLRPQQPRCQPQAVATPAHLSRAQPVSFWHVISPADGWWVAASCSPSFSQIAAPLLGLPDSSATAGMPLVAQVPGTAASTNGSRCSRFSRYSRCNSCRCQMRPVQPLQPMQPMQALHRQQQVVPRLQPSTRPQLVWPSRRPSGYPQPSRTSTLQHCHTYFAKSPPHGNSNWHTQWCSGRSSDHGTPDRWYCDDVDPCPRQYYDSFCCCRSSSNGGTGWHSCVDAAGQLNCRIDIAKIMHHICRQQWR